MNTSLTIKSNVVLIIFVGLITLGYVIHGDFGIPSDELWLRELGLVSAKFVANWLGIPYPDSSVYLNLPNLEEYPDGDHGSIFELFYIFIESFFNIEDIAQGYRLKQLLIFGTALLGMFAVYCMAKRRFNNKAAGIVALLIMVLSPRIFADSFYNAKDIVFMAFFAIAMNTMLIFLQKKNISSAIAHGLATAIAFDIRIAAVVFPILTTILILIDLFRPGNNKKIIVRAFLIYIITICVFIPLFWPWLWIDLLGNLQKAFHSAVSFERLIVWTLYRGFYYTTDGLPWHYLPIYIIVTTPIVYLMLFVVGGFFSCLRLVRRKFIFWNDFTITQDLIFLGLFCGPIVLSMVLKPVLYNGWRHFYFLYPAFVLIVVAGLMSIMEILKKWLLIRYFVSALMFAFMLDISLWMYRSHPITNTFFNFIAGSNWKAKYDVDYWGLSTYVALKHILDNNDSETIKIKPLQCINAEVSTMLLTEKERERIELVYGDEEADYMLLNYIFLDPQQSRLWKNIAHHYPVHHNITAGNEIVISILREKHPHSQTWPLAKTGFRAC